MARSVFAFELIVVPSIVRKALAEPSYAVKSTVPPYGSTASPSSNRMLSPDE